MRLPIIIMTLILSFTFAPFAELNHNNIATVEAATMKLRLTNTESKKTMYQYLTYEIKANIKDSKIKFSSSNKKVATINKKGVVTAKKKGTTIITVKYGKQSKKVKLTVKASGKNYSPKRVCQIANQRLKNTRNKNGEKLTYIPDDLKAMLKRGEITKKEYNKYYPTDGTGYFIYYIRPGFDNATDITGQRLKNESQIAEYLVGFYRAGDEKYFYVAYGGKVNIRGTVYYKFQLHRA